MKKKQHMLIKCNFKSFHPNLLEKNLTRILKKAKIMNINIKGVSSLPTRTKRFTVLRSPHVYKTAREQFELKTHSRVFVAFFDLNNENDKKKAKLFINFIKINSGGLQFKVTYNLT